MTKRQLLDQIAIAERMDGRVSYRETTLLLLRSLRFLLEQADDRCELTFAPVPPCLHEKGTFFEKGRSRCVDCGEFVEDDTQRAINMMSDAPEVT